MGSISTGPANRKSASEFAGDFSCLRHTSCARGPVESGTVTVKYGLSLPSIPSRGRWRIVRSACDQTQSGPETTDAMVVAFPAERCDRGHSAAHQPNSVESSKPAIWPVVVLKARPHMSRASPMVRRSMVVCKSRRARPGEISPWIRATSRSPRSLAAL